MKRRAFFLGILIILFCGACQKENTPLPIEENHSTYEDSVDPKDKDKQDDEENSQYPDCVNTYNEPDDSLDGINQNELNGLIVAANKVVDTYQTYNQIFLNDSAKRVYKINYSEEIIDEFTYTQEKSETFNLIDFNQEYISSGEFTRLSNYKYESRRQETVYDFVNVIYPTLNNRGYFLVFTKVTIELTENNEIYRIRLYTDVTQEGYFIDSHKKQENTNWYLLFGQAYLINKQ